MISLHPFRTPVAQAVPLPPRNADDLLARAQLAYEQSRAAQLVYRQQVVGRVFTERFGVEPQAMALAKRPDVRDVWSWGGAGLCWYGSDDGYGAADQVWFRVLTREHGWATVCSLAELGELSKAGAKFERWPGAS